MNTDSSSLQGGNTAPYVPSNRTSLANTFGSDMTMEQNNNKAINDIFSRLNKDGNYQNALTSLADLKRTNANPTMRELLASVPFLGRFLKHLATDPTQANNRIDALSQALLQSQLTSANSRRIFNQKTALAKAIGFNPLGLANNFLSSVGTTSPLGSWQNRKNQNEQSGNALLHLLLAFLGFKTAGTRLATAETYLAKAKLK